MLVGFLLSYGREIPQVVDLMLMPTAKGWNPHTSSSIWAWINPQLNLDTMPRNKALIYISKVIKNPWGVVNCFISDTRANPIR